MGLNEFEMPPIHALRVLFFECAEFLFCEAYHCGVTIHGESYHVPKAEIIFGAVNSNGN